VTVSKRFMTLTPGAAVVAAVAKAPLRVAGRAKGRAQLETARASATRLCRANSNLASPVMILLIIST
jgi:hypothetical protein